MFPLHGCLCTTRVQCLWMLEGGVRSSNFNLYETSVSWESTLPWIGHKIKQPADPLAKTTPRTEHVDLRIPGYFRGDRVEEAACIQAMLPSFLCHFTMTPLFLFFQEVFFYFLQFLLLLFSFLLSCPLALFGHAENRTEGLAQVKHMFCHWDKFLATTRPFTQPSWLH